MSIDDTSDECIVRCSSTVPGAWIAQFSQTCGNAALTGSMKRVRWRVSNTNQAHLDTCVYTYVSLGMRSYKTSKRMARLLRIHGRSQVLDATPPEYSVLEKSSPAAHQPPLRQLASPSILRCAWNTAKLNWKNLPPRLGCASMNPSTPAICEHSVCSVH